MNIFLGTERLFLRQFTEDDADNLYELNSDSQVMRFINGGQPIAYETIQKSLLKNLAYYQKYEHYGFWAVIEKANNEFIGWFHFIPATDNTFMRELGLVNSDEIALGYRLRQASWNKGLATEGSQALVAKGFNEWNVQKVIAWALTVNKASIRVMKKVGLKKEKEFCFTESQLPNLQPEERKAVKYSLSQDEFEGEK